MVKKILRIFAGILSIPFFLASAFILFGAAYVAIDFLKGKISGLNITAYVVIAIIVPILFYIGWKLLFINKTIAQINKKIYYLKNREQILYEAELERRREQERLEKEQEAEARANRKQIEAAYQYTRKTTIPKKTEAEKNQEILEKWQKLKESYVDQPKPDKPQTFKICMCKKGDGIFTVVRIIAALVFVLSIGLVVYMINHYYDLTDSQRLICFAIATVMFFGGLFVFFGTRGDSSHDKDRVFVLTDQRLIYAFDLSEFHDKSFDGIPTNKFAQMKYFHDKYEEEKKVADRIEEIKADAEELYRIVNAEVNNTDEPKTTVSYLIKKLNSPQLMKRWFRTKIKYWNEEKEKWELFVLPKNTEHYDEICQVVKSRRMKL